jgi:hypothetical protein
MRTTILSIALVLSISTLTVAQTPPRCAAAPALGPLTVTPALSPARPCPPRRPSQGIAAC